MSNEKVISLIDFLEPVEEIKIIKPDLLITDVFQKEDFIKTPQKVEEIDKRKHILSLFEKKIK